MSVSRERGRTTKTAGKREAEAADFVLPPTVSCDALLDSAGSDRRFRTLVHDLLTISARMEIVRTHLGRRLGISGPQYSLLVAIAHMQEGRGVSVGTVAQTLHVSSAFVASETGKLSRMGLLLKRPNPDDGRGVLLSIAPAGRLKIDRIAAEIRAVNDLFFGSLDARSFAALGNAASILVSGSQKAVQYIDAFETEPTTALDAAG